MDSSADISDKVCVISDAVISTAAVLTLNRVDINHTPVRVITTSADRPGKNP